MQKAEDCLKAEEDRVIKLPPPREQAQAAQGGRDGVVGQIMRAQLLEKEHSGCSVLLRDGKVRRDLSAVALICRGAQTRPLPWGIGCTLHL